MQAFSSDDSCLGDFQVELFQMLSSSWFWILILNLDFESRFWIFVLTWQKISGMTWQTESSILHMVDGWWSLYYIISTINPQGTERLSLSQCHIINHTRPLLPPKRWKDQGLLIVILTLRILVWQRGVLEYLLAREPMVNAVFAALISRSNHHRNGPGHDHGHRNRQFPINQFCLYCFLLRLPPASSS